MTLAQFQESLDLYGTHLAQWPAELRAAAEKALATSSELQRCFKKAQDFEARLHGLAVAEPRSDLADRIIRQARQTPKRQFTWAPALAFAMLFLCGFVMGFTVMQKTAVRHATTATTATNLNDFLYESDGVSQ